MEGYAAGKPAASADAGLAVLVSELTGLVGELAGAGAAASSFDEIEQLVMVRGRELLRKVMQHVMDACAAAEPRLAGVADAAGMPRPRAERGHARAMISQFGPVVIERMAYRAPGQPNLYPRDAVLNLPLRRYSWCLQRAVVEYVLAGAYEQARRFVAAVTGVVIGKQQLEQITIEAAADAPGFYPALARDQGQGGEGPGRPAGPLLISADCKGVAMLPGALRRSGAKAPGQRVRNFEKRRGTEEKGHKRMAQLGCVFDSRAGLGHPLLRLLFPAPEPFVPFPVPFRGLPGGLRAQRVRPHRHALGVRGHPQHGRPFLPVRAGDDGRVRHRPAGRELLRVRRGPRHDLLQLPFPGADPRRGQHEVVPVLERPGPARHLREPLQLPGMPARRQVQHRVPPVQVRHPLLPGPVGDPAHPHPPQHRHHRRRGPLPAAPAAPRPAPSAPAAASPRPPARPSPAAAPPARSSGSPPPPGAPCHPAAPPPPRPYTSPRPARPAAPAPGPRHSRPPPAPPAPDPPPAPPAPRSPPARPPHTLPPRLPFPEFRFRTSEP